MAVPNQLIKSVETPKDHVASEELEPQVRAVLLRIRPKVYHQLMRDKMSVSPQGQNNTQSTMYSSPAVFSDNFPQERGINDVVTLSPTTRSIATEAHQPINR